jgi:hypothetical protein
MKTMQYAPIQPRRLFPTGQAKIVHALEYAGNHFDTEVLSQRETLGRLVETHEISQLLYLLGKVEALYS